MWAVCWTVCWMVYWTSTKHLYRIVCQSISNMPVSQEYGRASERIAWIPLSSQIGLLAGAAIWGFSADIIGRKLAFNTSLFICAIFVLIAGAMPTFASFCVMLVYRGQYLRIQKANFLGLLFTPLRLAETTSSMPQTSLNFFLRAGHG